MPAAELITEAAPNVIGPLKVLLPDVKEITPPLLVMLLVAVMPLEIANVEPEAIEAAADPRAVFADIAKVPPLIVAPPL